MILQLLTPAISMTFALCFLAIYSYDKTKAAPAILSIAYAAGTLSFILDYFRLHFDSNFSAVLTNTLYTATIFLTTTGIAIHFKKKPPFLLMSTLALIQAILLIYYIFWQPDISMRVIISSATAAILMACSLMVIPTKTGSLINKVMFWIAFATATQFFLRALSITYIVLLQGSLLTDANYSQSIITTSLHFSVAIFSLLFAVTMCVAFGLEAISEVKKLADTDVLSGLLNRRGFELQARKIIKEAQENKLPLTLIVTDLDKFKSINDQYGHTVGDDVIQTFGKLLRLFVKDGDIVGRLGGEEFCILLKTSDLNIGRLCAESIRETLEKQLFFAGEKSFSVTSSFGVAQLQSNENYGTLFTQADEELYYAKNSGRNQVRPKSVNHTLRSVG